ncbi:vitelline membrane outer layer protein 1 homolog [Rhineura floridana]|uniref:vitelline membrane outer layer protein 1 homolog n=1 Tax=Rhineura floridana TaxID=261503 RepID=UPI002AC84E41|nr:vitelline membrane outer layer protein 1 homolog [Rhineura floridana]
MQPLAVVLFLPFVCLTTAFDKIISTNGTFANRRNYSTISVVNGGRWGDWTWSDFCPEKSYASGFSVKVHDFGGFVSDDTSLNGIRLYCSSGHNSSIMYTIESSSGEYGYWSGIRWCPQDSVLRSFQLKVESDQGALKDDTAVNNIKFRCSNGVVLEESGGRFGEYGGWSNVCVKGGICGIQTRQEPYRPWVTDNTGMNDVRFFCCE